jgi:hypothetical protein
MALSVIKKATGGMVKVPILAGTLFFYSSAAHTENRKILKCSHITLLSDTTSSTTHTTHRDKKLQQ